MDVLARLRAAGWSNPHRRLIDVDLTPDTQAWISSVVELDACPWLLIRGPKRVRSSEYAARVALELQECIPEITMRRDKALKLESECAAPTHNPASVVQAIQEAGVWVLDDLAGPVFQGRRQYAWLTELRQLLEAREGRPTIITTTEPGDQLRRAFGNTDSAQSVMALLTQHVTPSTSLRMAS